MQPALIPSPSPSPIATRVAALTDAARRDGRALALDIADRLDALAVEALALSTLGAAVTVGARGRAAGMVERLRADAAAIRQLES